MTGQWQAEKVLQADATSGVPGMLVFPEAMPGPGLAHNLAVSGLPRKQHMMKITGKTLSWRREGCGVPGTGWCPWRMCCGSQE